tara:strand:+ start:8464 stop:8676 length:213 start_codon:yes stop_codon:yes gene_type:complete
MISYLKGIPKIIAIIVILILVGAALVLFNVLYAIIVGIILIIAFFAVPYYLGRSQPDEEPGNYEIKKIKE